MLYATVEADVEAIKLTIPDFEAETGIKINLDSMPFANLQQKIFSELAAESPFYDIINVDVSMMATVMNKLEPLSSYVQEPRLNDIAELEIEDFIPKVFYDTVVYNPEESHRHASQTDTIDVDAIRSEGFDIFGLPIQANALTMSYRKDMFDDPKEQAAYQKMHGNALRVPQTWEEFVPVTQFFTRPEQRLYGTTLMAGSGDWATDDFKTLLACWGGDGHLVTDDFELAFAEPEGVAALTYYADLINKHKVTPPGVTSFSWDEAGSTFSSGLTAISMNYHKAELNPDVKGEVAFAVIPKKVTRGPHFGTWMLSVNKFSRNKEWAYRACNWFTSSDVQTKMLETRLHPTRTSVYDAALSDPKFEEFANFYDVLRRSLEVGVGRPRLTNYPEVDEAIWVAVNRAASGRATPEAAIDEAADEVTNLLEQAGYPVAG